MRDHANGRDCPERESGTGPVAEIFGRYAGVLKSFTVVGGSVGTLVPAAAFFSNLAPPFLPLSAVVVAAVSAATLIIVFLRGQPVRMSRTAHSQRLGQATRRLAIALALITVYGGLLNWCTVEESGERFQIGFYKFDLGLTAEGREVKALHPAETPRQWIMNDGLFTEDGPAKIWSSGHDSPPSP